MLQLEDRIIKSEKVEWRKLSWLQHESLKELADTSAEKLLNSLGRFSVIRAFDVWHCEKEDKTYILDGHHLQKLLDYGELKGRFRVPDLMTANYIKCKDRKEAGEILLAKSAVYARLTEDGLDEFVSDFDIELDDIFNFAELTDIDVDYWNVPEEVADSNVKEDEVPDVPENPITEPGDFYEFRSIDTDLNHKLLCKSSVDKLNYQQLFKRRKAKLIVTDPPYNIDYKSASGMSIQNDNMDDNKFEQFIFDFYSSINKFAVEGCPYYIFHSDGYGHVFRKQFIQSGHHLAQCLIWVKNAMVMGRQDYHWQHEPILYGWKEGAAHNWYSDRKQATVIHHKKPSKNDVHPTMKPLGLLVYLIENSSQSKDLVFDGFLGSGSTLIASEMCGRNCYGFELDPKYADVIVRRYIEHQESNEQKYTIQKNGKIMTEEEIELMYQDQTFFYQAA